MTWFLATSRDITPKGSLGRKQPSCVGKNNQVGPNGPNICWVHGTYLGTTPHPVTVTTRIIPFLIGNPYKPSFVTVTGWGVDLRHTCWPWDVFFSSHWWQEQTMTRLEKCQPIRNVDWNIGYIFSIIFAPLNSAAQMLSIKHPCCQPQTAVPSKLLYQNWWFQNSCPLENFLEERGKATCSLLGESLRRSRVNG